MAETVKIPARLFRAGEIEVRADAADGEADDRRVTLAFSSETPVLRYFGWEVLGHGDGEVDMSRLASGRAPLLTDHRHTIDAQVGVVESARIDGTEGQAVVRFGKSARADEVLARVRDGEITGVSVGYEVTRMVQVGERDGEPIIRASWRPYEITLCPVPADATVGIGRDGSAEGAEITLTIETKDAPMADKIDTTTPTGGDDAQRSKAPAQANVQADHKAERTRSKEIRALARKFNVSDDKVDNALEGDTSVAAFQRQILDDMGSTESEATRSKNSAIGLTDKETRSFSLIKAVRFLSNPNDKRAREAAAFEIEASEAAQAHLGREARGILVPADVLTSQAFGRSQNVGTPAKGGNLVATDYLDGSFIGLLRKRAALTRLGVRTLTGLDGNVAIPRQIGGGTAYWLGEGGAPTETDLDFNLLNLTPHTLAAAVPITRRAMIQATPDMEALVRDDLIQVMALEMDRVGLNGDASGDAPNGLLDFAGINTVDFAAPQVGNAQPSWNEVVQMETEIASDDADVDGMQYVFNAAMRGNLKSRLDANGRRDPMMVDGEVNGYRALVSNNAPAGGMLFGNWSDFIMAMWSGLDLTVDTATLAASGGVHLRAFQDVDFGARHVESFCYGRQP